MSSYYNHQTICDLCDEWFDNRLSGLVTECGTTCCDACTDEHVQFLHTDSDCFAYLNEDSL